MGNKKPPVGFEDQYMNRLAEVEQLCVVSI